MIYGLSVQKVGHLPELRCPECMRNGRFPPRIVQETKRSLLTLRCELHPENFGEWHSEAEMDQDKRDLARRIGLI